MKRIQNIKYIIIDVDGTMTDGGIYYDETGNEWKKFSVKDAAGIWAAQKYGIKIMVLTGRECKATERTMRELKVDILFQNVKDKLGFLLKYVENNQIDLKQIAYIGDDLNDLPVMKRVGIVGCPSDACEEVKQIANYIGTARGGNGAVCDVIRMMLQEADLWNQLIEKIYV
mgnify:CR=1 FL=1